MENHEITKGIESLQQAVKKDIAAAKAECFSPNGCDKQCKSSHGYCDKYKWVMERAAQYASITGKSIEEVVAAWEEQRGYWYMNFYQNCNQPEVKTEGMKVILFEDWVAQLKVRFGEDKAQWKFKCPCCGNVQCGADFEAIGVKDWSGKVQFSCISRYKGMNACNWTLGGLLQIHDTVVVKDLKVFPVFEIAAVV